jgi:hypothetical protein
MKISRSDKDLMLMIAHALACTSLVAAATVFWGLTGWACGILGFIFYWCWFYGLLPLMRRRKG